LAILLVVDPCSAAPEDEELEAVGAAGNIEELQNLDQYLWALMV